MALDPARANALRLEAYAEVARLEEMVAALKKERKYLKGRLRKARIARNKYRRELTTALHALALRQKKIKDRTQPPTAGNS